MIHCETAVKETFVRWLTISRKSWCGQGLEVTASDTLECMARGFGVILKVPFALIPVHTSQMCKYFYSKQ